MKDKRIIINYTDEVSDLDAVAMVYAVVEGGKISGGFGKNRKQYCYVSTFRNGSTVHCPTRYKQKSERFNIIKSSPNAER